MTSLTHTAVGLLVGKVIYDLSPGTALLSQENFLIFSSLISNFPDINMLWVKDFYRHHDDFTHYPFSLLFVGIIFLFLNIFFSFPLEIWTFLLLWGIHLIMDFFGIRAGIRCFYPWKQKEYSFLKLYKSEDLNRREQLRHAYRNGEIFFELFFFSGSLSLFLR